MKSKFFQSYLGFDDMTSDQFNLYFFDIKKGKALQQLLIETGQILKDDQQLFKFWAKELLYAFKDITYKSTYSVEGDITIRNIYISDLGIKLYIKKIKFGELRDNTMQYHLQVEAKMLNNYAKILIEMLTNDNQNILGSMDDILANLDIIPELKAILYECLHAQDKIQEKEKENYDNEVNAFILQEKLKLKQIEDTANKEGHGTESSAFKDLIEFKEAVEGDIGIENQRTVMKKKGNPQANKRNYDEENLSHGVAHEVDLVLQKIAGQKQYGQDEFLKAQGQYNRGLISYSGDIGQTKQKKQERYLTVQSLLDHPYFIRINTADISSVIDQYEILLNNEGHRATHY